MSIVEDEKSKEEIIDNHKQNLNITSESTENMDGVIQNDIYDISSDSDEDTGQLEAKQIAQVVHLDDVNFIENENIQFPSYYQKRMFTKMISYLKNKNLNEVLNLRITTKGYPFLVRDIMTLLTPNTWLNDSVIQNYVSLLVRHCEKTKDMNTDFINSFEQFGYDSVFKWFKKLDLNNLNKIIVPINPGRVHWALIVIEIWEGRIYCFDSFKKATYVKELSLVVDFLNRAIIDYINYSGVQRTAPKVWQFFEMSGPHQENSYDCGVFTCMNARSFLLNKNLSMIFEQKFTPILRQIIAWELLNSKLESF